MGEAESSQLSHKENTNCLQRKFMSAHYGISGALGNVKGHDGLLIRSLLHHKQTQAMATKC